MHLATHALLPTELGQCQTGPAILTSAPPNAPSVDAGFLRTGDIENLKLDADLVVLSACDTAGPGRPVRERSRSPLREWNGFDAGYRRILVTGVVTPLSGALWFLLFSVSPFATIVIGCPWL